MEYWEYPTIQPFLECNFRGHPEHVRTFSNMRNIPEQGEVLGNIGYVGTLASRK